MRVTINTRLRDGRDVEVSAALTREPARTAYDYDIDGLVALDGGGREVELSQADQDRIVGLLVDEASERAEGEYYERGEHERSRRLEG